MKFAELIDKGMKEGKLTKAMAEGKFKELFEKNGAEFAESFLAEMPVVVDVKGLPQQLLGRFLLLFTVFEY